MRELSTTCLIPRCTNDRPLFFAWSLIFLQGAGREGGGGCKHNTCFAYHTKRFTLGKRVFFRPRRASRLEVPSSEGSDPAEAGGGAQIPPIF